MKQDDIYQFATNQALEMIMIFNSAGIITYANESAKQQLEYGDELCGRSIEEIFPAEMQDGNIHFGTFFEFDQEVHELTAYRKNKTCFLASVRILCWEETIGDNICLLYDVSKMRFLEKKIVNTGAEVAEAEKVKSEFVANVTHELRTPVNGILGNTRELMNVETDEDKLYLLRLIERGCNDMHAIINNILDFSKLEAEKFILEPRKFELRNMMDYVKRNHINKITEKGLEFFVTISPDVPEYIIGDELRIVQILNNLLSNACKFTTIGKIAVEVVKTAQIDNRVELFFIVLDTGIGIEKANLDKLFRSFSQVDASISRKYGGTGLGLNICKQLVELMDGNIRVESEYGKGSMFCFHIWVEVPKEELEQQTAYTGVASGPTISSLSELEKDEAVWEYGNAVNMEELRKKMSKLILSVEMENWEKAEMFAEAVKHLTNAAPPEVKSAALRLKMAVQKGDYDKVATAFDKLQEMI